MQFGFSIVGIVFLAMLFIPNIIWSRNIPEHYDELSAKESRVLLLFERIGQVAATCTAVVFVCPYGFSAPWCLWLIASAVLIALYEFAWVRYFRNGSQLNLLYAPLGPIPIPIATLPVAAFFLLGIWYLSPCTIASAIVLGIGHIGIHRAHEREIAE